MQWKNTALKYGAVAKSFHWLMALLVIGLLCIGFYMTNAEKTLSVFKLYGLHKSIGVTVLALVVVRLLWRLINVTPPLPESMPSWQKLAAHLSHVALYGLMFAMPMIGWLMSSAAGFTISVFGLFSMPNLIAPDKEFFETLRFLHWLGAWSFVVVISTHVTAALYHHFFHRDTVLLRMLPLALRHKD